MRRVLSLAIAAAAAALLVPAAASAREPANQNDPCSQAGRNICGTNGVGFSQRYRYGIRWFGDFRGAVPGVNPVFCIDLRWWYPAARFQYRIISNRGLRNTDGKLVSTANQAKMAYALWHYGRSNSPQQQAATMLYVHGLMGDAAPGEVDPAGLGNARVSALYNTISRNAALYRGPYRLVATVSSNPVVGRTAQVRVRLISATGRAVPNVPINLSGTGAAGLPASARTNGSGVATVSFTPTDVAGLTVNARTSAVASNLPRIYRATTPVSAARNAQRMAAAASQTLATTVGASVTKGSIAISTKATPNQMLVGEQNRDEVTIGGVGAGSPTRALKVRLHGPFASEAAITCAGTPVAESSLAFSRSGVRFSDPFTATQPGWYQYQIAFDGDAGLSALTTSCADTAERFHVQTQPRVRTVVSTPTLRPGGSLSDTVEVTGLSGQTATVDTALYGPFASREAIRCDGPPVWSGSLTFSGDGEQSTAPVALTVPGYYTYRERIVGSETVRPFEGVCGEAAETAIVIGAPTIVTQISAAETRPGATITDQVRITGLGVVAAQVQVELWGPYDSLAAMSCSGTPYATQTFTANGDGVYTTEPVTIDRAGYYTYRESMAGGGANDPANTRCGEASETTFAKPGPNVTTRTTEAIRPGATLFDTVQVTGLGKTPGVVELSLYGPFASRTAINCSGTPVWRGRITVAGDGTYRSASVRLPKVGFYTYREKLLASPFFAEVQNTCRRALETALVRPLILTGPGDPSSTAITAPSPNPAPTRIQIDRLRVDARIGAAGIDLGTGALAVPVNVRRVGWWRDGAAPGDAFGTTLLAGHVDSSRQGAGAFVNLRNARAGMVVRVTTADGRVRSYRVTRVQRMLKANLPAGIFTQRGSRKLVLVTCGGPFQADRHYRDNIVVTAVPA